MSLVTKLSSEPLFFFLHLSYPAFSAFITLMTLCGRTSLWLFLPTGLPFPWGQHLDYCCSSRSWMTYFKKKSIQRILINLPAFCFILDFLSHSQLFVSFSIQVLLKFLTYVYYASYQWSQVAPLSFRNKPELFTCHSSVTKHNRFAAWSVWA